MHDILETSNVPNRLVDLITGIHANNLNGNRSDYKLLENIPVKK
jgi:hypothetical protein